MGEYIEESQPTGGSIFPFLSVLCCVIGTMVLILIAGSLNAAGFINVSELEEAIMAKTTTCEKGLAELGRKERDLAELDEKKDSVAKRAVAVESLGALRDQKLDLQNQKEEVMGRTANIRAEIARVRAIPRNKELIDEQNAAQTEHDSALGDKATSEAEVKAAEARRAELEAERQKLESTIDAPKTQVSIAGEGVEGEAFLVEVAPDLVVVHSDGLSIARGTSVDKAGAEGDGGLLDRLAVELAQPETERIAVLLVRPGATELHDEAERRFRKWRVSFSREPVDSGWEIVPETAPE